MIRYPTVDELIETNKIVLRVTRDKKPHRLLAMREGIQAKIDETRGFEHLGITYQAAYLMKSLVASHPFDGANHRTAYLATLFFLTQNGKSLQKENPLDVEAFMAEIGQKSVGVIQKWIEENIIV
jgi:death-on-curing family protein